MTTITTAEGEVYDFETFASLPIEDIDTLWDLFKKFGEEYKFPNVECTNQKVVIWKKEHITKSFIEVDIYKSLPDSFEIHAKVDNSIGFIDAFMGHTVTHFGEFEEFLEKEIKSTCVLAVNKKSVLNQLF